MAMAVGKAVACKAEKLKSTTSVVPVMVDNLVIDLTDLVPEENGETKAEEAQIIDVTSDEPMVVGEGQCSSPAVGDVVPITTSKSGPISLFPLVTFRVLSLTKNDPGVEFSLSVNEKFQRIYYEYAYWIDRQPDDVSIKNSKGIISCMDKPPHAGVHTCRSCLVCSWAGCLSPGTPHPTFEEVDRPCQYLF